MKGRLFVVLLLKSKILAVMIVLMAFAGQASAMGISTCRMNDNQQSASLNPVTTVVTAARHSSAIINAGPAFDGSVCCDQNCDCSLGNCAAAVLPSISYDGNAVLLLQQDNRYQSLIPDQSCTSPYRPPISL